MNELRRGRPPRAPSSLPRPGFNTGSPRPVAWHVSGQGSWSAAGKRSRCRRSGLAAVERGPAVYGSRPSGRFAGIAEAAASAGLPARMRDGNGVFDETNADGAASGLDAAGGRRPVSVTTGGPPFARSLEPVAVRGLTCKTVGNGDGGVAPRFGIHALGQGLDECLTRLVDGLPAPRRGYPPIRLCRPTQTPLTACPVLQGTRRLAVESPAIGAVAIIGFAGASPRASRTRRPRCLGGRVAPVLLR